MGGSSPDIDETKRIWPPPGMIFPDVSIAPHVYEKRPHLRRSAGKRKQMRSLWPKADKESISVDADEGASLWNWAIKALGRENYGHTKLRRVARGCSCCSRIYRCWRFCAAAIQVRCHFSGPPLPQRRRSKALFPYLGRLLDQPGQRRHRQGLRQGNGGHIADLGTDERGREFREGQSRNRCQAH